MQIFLIGIVFLNIILYFFNSNIANILNLFDIPDGKRKIHYAPVPLTGGIIIFLNISYCFIFNQLNVGIELFDNIKNLNIFFLSCFVLWVLGIIDDKKNISANLKFLIILFIIIINLLFDKSIIINKVYLTFFNEFNLGFFAYIWTAICFLLFINALNMFDGINLQTAIYSSFICLLFIFNSFLSNFFLIILFSLIIFCLLNLKNKSFMGDSGTYLLSYLFSYFFIRSYNEFSLFYADEIVLIMLIPGLDLMRLFIIRILKKKHPFSPDKQHLHHYLLNRFGYYRTLLIIQSLIIVPIIISLLINQVVILLMIQFFVYSFLILKFKN